MEPFPDVMREGRELIVHRDADLSKWCFDCAESSDGRGIHCHLRMDKSGVFHHTPLNNLPLWFYAVEYFLYFFFFVFDLPASRKRRLTFGLCAAHRRKRLWMLLGSPFSLVAGFALLGFGIFSKAPTWLGLPAAILGVGLLVTAWALYRFAPGPQLTGKGGEYFWIQGAGKKFMEAHPERVKKPVETKNNRELEKTASQRLECRRCLGEDLLPDWLQEDLMAGTFRLARRVLAAAIAGAAISLGIVDQSLAASRPNVIIILADDMGFSDVGCYGGEIHTPHIDTMAQQGLRFAQFYNMARCCPTRAALLTGLYPHEAGIGAMNQKLDDKPAYQGELNDKCVTIAEVLKDNGYHTGMVGKWHLCHLNIAHEPVGIAKSMLAFQSDLPISESKANWPCNRGFEDHWGTIPGVENYYDPYGLVHNEETIKPDKPDFYYTDFITEHAVQMVDTYSADPKPFFMYVAYTAPHWPLQAREEDIAHYAQTYSVGWDVIRQQRFDRQIAMGLVDKDWGLSPRAFNKALNDGESVVGPWIDAPAKEWQARRMAVYAAQIENLDRGVGKILDEISAKGIDQNTVVIFLSDNGACQEQVQNGWYDIPNKMRDGEKIEVGNKSAYMPGPQEVYQSYGPAWANASNTPFRKFKHFTEEGGIATPFIVRWPGTVNQTGQIEHDQVGDVIDFMPTILDLASATYPKTFKDHDITPEEGIDLVPVIKGGPAIDRGPICWEHEGNRAVRIGNWKLVAPHGEQWKLFDMVNDRTELKDVSADHPDKVKELHAAYDAWVKKCGVEEWPIND